MHHSTETAESPLGNRFGATGSEPVLDPRTAITATTSMGTISIRAGQGLERWLTWDGETFAIEMVPRTKRWFGSLGLTGQGTWVREGKAGDAVSYEVEEGLQHFKTPRHAAKWIYAQTKIMTYVWRNDGIMVGWRVDQRDGMRISVCVWQVLVGGKKPKALPDAQEESIIVEQRPD